MHSHKQECMHPHQYLQTRNACSQTLMHVHTDNTYLHTYTEAELTSAEFFCFCLGAIPSSAQWILLTVLRNYSWRNWGIPKGASVLTWVSCVQSYCLPYPLYCHFGSNCRAQSLMASASLFVSYPGMFAWWLHQLWPVVKSLFNSLCHFPPLLFFALSSSPSNLRKLHLMKPAGG